MNLKPNLPPISSEEPFPRRPLQVCAVIAGFAGIGPQPDRRHRRVGGRLVALERHLGPASRTGRRVVGSALCFQHGKARLDRGQPHRDGLHFLEPRHCFEGLQDV